MMGDTMSLQNVFDHELAYKTLLALCKIGPRVSGTNAEIRAVLLIEDHFRRFGLSSLQILGHEHQYYDAKKATIGLADDTNLVEGVPCWMSASTPSGGIKAESMYIGSYEMVENIDAKKVWNKVAIVLLFDQVKDEAN